MGGNRETQWRLHPPARAHRRVFVVEVMGRQSGYLAMASSIAAGADACLFREQGKDADALLEKIVGEGWFTPQAVYGLFLLRRQ